VAVKVPAHNDAEVCELARLSTVAQLHTIVRCARPAPDATDPDAPSESMSIRYDDDGRVHGQFELDADHGRIVEAALKAARDRLFQDGSSAVSWVDALLEVCQRSLDAESPARRERFRVNLFLGPSKDIPASWGDGFSVPDAIRRFVTCDGLLVPTFVEDSYPVSVGRSQHAVPARTRRLVLQRDRKCRVPWCQNTRWLDIHHIVHYDDGGPTDTPNICALCRACHRLHHRGELGIAGNADDPRITQPTMPPPSPRRRYEHPLGERLHARWLFLSDPPNAPPADAA
jgi:hypothetical protein